MAVGLVTVAWAAFETTLDFIVGLTFNKLGGHPKHDQIPRSMMRKVSYLRDFAKASELPSEILGQIRTIADTADDLKERRNDAIHGALMQSHGEEVRLFKVLYAKTHHNSEDVVVSPASLIQLVRDVSALLNLCMPLVIELAKLSKEPLDDFFSEASR
jgi:hypothetical protein